MKNYIGFGKLLVVLSLSLAVGAGCVSWKHGWETKPYKGKGYLDAGVVKEYTVKLEKSAVTREQISDLIESLEYILSVEPENHDVMDRLAKAWVAMAVGHSRDRAEEGHFLRKAITTAEKSMMLNPNFAAAIDRLPEKDRGVAAAVGTLGIESKGSMYVWAMATLLYYEDCLSEVLKITNEDVVDEVTMVLSRHLKLLPEDAQALSIALRGFAQAVRPDAKMVIVADDFESAVKAAPKSFVISWLQAKYVFGNFGDKINKATAYDAIKAIDLNTAAGFMPLNRAIRLALEKN